MKYFFYLLFFFSIMHPMQKSTDILTSFKLLLLLKNKSDSYVSLLPSDLIPPLDEFYNSTYKGGYGKNILCAYNSDFYNDKVIRCKNHCMFCMWQGNEFYYVHQITYQFHEASPEHKANADIALRR